MKTKNAIFLASLTLLFVIISPFTVLSAQGEKSVPMQVTRTVWGQDPENPSKAYPGDTGVSLTVEVQNLSPDETIKGISAVLLLEDGLITDLYGNPNATATGKPTVGEILNPTDEIAPKGFFTLTFTLDIDENTVPGTYKYNMTVNYSVKQNNDYTEGTPQRLVVQLIISKIESTITVSVSPGTVRKGELIRISGSIQPARDNTTVTLIYHSPDGSMFNRTVRTSGDGSFTESYRPEVEGVWSVNASWVGDEKYVGDSASISFEVRLPVSITVVTSNVRLTAGVDNPFNITVQNSGDVAVSALEMILNVPAPLVVHGENRWNLNYLGPGNSTFIHVKVYVPPSSIGSTYSGSLSLNYRDDYGETQSETHQIGLITVGRIELVAYGESINPQPAWNGSKVEITTTLLNKGNTPAMYVNASILPNPVLRLTTESSSYIGEVDENSQAPFTLAAYVKNNVTTGVYPVKIGITYRDDQYVNHYMEVHMKMFVEARGTESSSTEKQTGSEDLVEVGLVLATVAAASVVIFLLYRRHQSRQKEVKNLG